MLCNNHPAISYISWYGLVIIGEDEVPYIISDGKSCMKYIYWEMDNPYILRESNEWIEESTTKKMIYINENGTATEVPHNSISIYYNDTGNGSASKLTGTALGKFDELNNKYMTIKEDVDGIKEVVGSSEAGSNSLVERVNKLEKTASSTNEKIQTISKDFTNSNNVSIDDAVTISLINNYSIDDCLKFKEILESNLN